MIEIIIIAALLILYFYFVMSVRPKKAINHYQQLLESLGYRVHVLPFSFLQNACYSTLWRDQVQKRDAYYYAKHFASKYDIGIYNIISTVTLDIYKPELAQQLLGPQSPYLYYKMPQTKLNMSRALGDSIVILEGEEWKRKRKIMNTILNYEFLKSNIQRSSESAI